MKIPVPEDVRLAALKVELWAKENGLKEWMIGGVADAEWTSRLIVGHRVLVEESERALVRVEAEERGLADMSPSSSSTQMLHALSVSMFKAIGDPLRKALGRE